MPTEYKIFYNDRVVVLSNKITKSFEKNDCLFIKYPKKDEIAEIIRAFENFEHINTLYILGENEEILFDHVKACYTIIEAAGGVVRRNDGKMLAIFRRGKWDLPKGKVEKGEFYSQAAIREVQEECGLKELEIGKRLFDTYHVYTEKGNKILKRTVWYDMTLPNDETPTPQTEEDITEIKWIDYQSISDIMKNTYESLKDIFIVLLSPEK
ncbi:MAG: NUDIX domain-containing protein [Bacteroidota bacterium]|nr:NUDIX domain-containing protein [Bacteroidota bacterium]